MKKLFLVVLMGVMLFGGARMVHAADSPSARIGPAMVYDSVNERVLLFGGTIYDNGYSFYNDLWSFKDGVWTEIDVPGTKPSGRFNIPMVYLPDTQQIFIYGGFSDQDRIGDTWIYDITGNQWTRLSTDTHPPRRSDAAIAYDAEHNVVVMFGGYSLNDNILDDTWVFDFSLMNWVEMTPETKPLNQYGGYMVYDSVNGVLLMYPGHWEIFSNGELTSQGYGDQIWTYSYMDDNWTELDTTPKPMGRYWFDLAYDSKSGELVLFGGSVGGDSQLQDTWVYNYASNSWRQIDSDTKPPVRANSYMVYDASNNSMVIFGGSHFNHIVYSDTWILDMESGTWSEAAMDSGTQNQEISQGIPGFSVYAVTLSLIMVVWVHRRGKIKV